MNLRSQRRMSAEVLGCSQKKVWMDSNEAEDISKAITKADVRRLIQKGIIKKKTQNEQSRGRARKILRQKKLGRRKGKGSRKGKKHSLVSSKSNWMKNIRSLRKTLKEMRDSSKITQSQYRKLYMMAKGGRFKSKSNMNLYIEKNISKSEE